MRTLDSQPVNGYIINLYQYARRYTYNNKELISNFNQVISDDNFKKNIKNDYPSIGTFDVVEIVSVKDFNRYRDVSIQGKKWLGRRQSVLLYELKSKSQNLNLINNYGESSKKEWINEKKEKVNKTFFCLTMLSLTNEVSQGVENIYHLLTQIKSKIHEVVDQVNSEFDREDKIEFEVYGTFNTSEIAVIWFSNQYTQVLKIVDFIKYLRIKDKNNIEKSVFFSAFSVISKAIENNNLDNINGKALIQISLDDTIKNNNDLNEFANELIENKDFDRIYHSVGEFDIVIETSSSHALKLIKKDEKLSVGKRDSEYKYIDEKTKFLKTNICLLYENEDPEIRFLDTVLNELNYIITYNKIFIDNNSYKYNVEELSFRKFDTVAKRCHLENKPVADIYINSEDYSICDLYELLRAKLKKYIYKNAGAVDTLDLIYSDYRSIISNAYNSIWTADLNMQFKAIFQTLLSLFESETIGDIWNDYYSLTNVFKQQIYHLSQSNRMFFDIPACHFRATGQYDYLMHAYYGISKKIIEIIYITQGNDPQSELIPFITVNTVPQVKSQLYLESEEPDRMRVINVDIPNSIIFDIPRGIKYLTHELFHYAVPKNRVERNKFVALYMMTSIFYEQIKNVIHNILISELNSLEQNEDTDDFRNFISILLFPDELEENNCSDLVDKKWIKLEETELYKFLSSELLKELKNKIIFGKYIDNLSGINFDKVFSIFYNDFKKYCYDKKSNAIFKDLFELFAERLRKKCIETLENLNVSNYGEILIRFVGFILSICDSYISTNRINTNLDELRLSSIRKNYENSIYAIWQGVREASVDIAMVSLNQMSLSDYFYFVFNNRLDTTPQNTNESFIDYTKDISLNVRLWLVIRYVSEIDPVDEDDVVEYLNNNFKIIYDTYDDKKDKLICFFNYIINMYLNLDDELVSTLSLFYDDVFTSILHDFDMEICIKKIKEENKEFLLDALNDFLVPEYSDSFDLNLQLANKFQKQKSLLELHESNKKIIKSKNRFQDNSFHYKFDLIEPPKSSDNGLQRHGYIKYVYSLSQLNDQISYCKNQFRTVANTKGIDSSISDSVWYRGQQKQSYVLYPSLFRNFNFERKEKYKTLRCFQQSIFEEFKHRADGTSEIETGYRYTQSDYIALMQHYIEISNFLDWTGNAFASLYFALEKVIEVINNSNDINENATAFSLYLFNPAIYNKIRKERISEKFNDPTCNVLLKEANFCFNDKSKNYNLIPNLSIQENAEMFKNYLFGEPNFDDFCIENEEEILKLLNSDNYKDFFMPLAVYTSRLNTRIKAQSGFFLAYNIYTPPLTKEKGEKYKNPQDAFDFVTLENIQERVLASNPEDVFLYKINVDSMCCKEIAEWLLCMGVSKPMIYPELEKIKEEFQGKYGK